LRWHTIGTQGKLAHPPAGSSIFYGESFRAVPHIRHQKNKKALGVTEERSLPQSEKVNRLPSGKEIVEPKNRLAIVCYSFGPPLRSMQLGNITPENFRELLSASMFLIGVMFSFLSLFKNGREHCLRMAGLFLLASLALFAHNAYSYFAALFIVATAVTQLEFLQNLAAIIRGSKEYFDYQKEYLSQKEVENSIEKDVKEIEEAPSEISEIQPSQKIISLNIDKNNLTHAQFGLLVEEYTFNFLEKKYRRPIQRYVRYIGKRNAVEFDGVMQIDKTDLIFEIKATRRSFFPTIFIMNSARRLLERVKEYQELTKREACLRFVLIGTFPSGYVQSLTSKKDQVLEKATDMDITFEAYSFAEIGLPDLQYEQEAKTTASKG